MLNHRSQTLQAERQLGDVRCGTYTNAESRDEIRPHDGGAGGGDRNAGAQRTPCQLLGF